MTSELQSSNANEGTTTTTRQRTNDTNTPQPTTTAATTIDDIYRDFIEDAILEHGELILAVRASSGETPQLRPRSLLTDWASVKEALAMLGFAPDSADEWRMLGVPRLEGPAPSLNMIERRVQLARNLTSLKRTGEWSAGDVQAAEIFDQGLEVARLSCARELPKILREKKKLPPKCIPRWLEPSGELLQYIHERAQTKGPGHFVALNLSNIQKVSLHGLAQARSVQDSRDTFEAIHKNPETCNGVLQRLGGGNLTTWAPTEQSALLQLINTFQKFAADVSNRGELHLLVPHDAYPRCATAENVLDLWGHELLGQR